MEHPLPTFSTKKAPMTAAERQRRCRANGKGRHRNERGRITGPEADRRRAAFAVTLAYLDALDIVEMAAAAGAYPMPIPPDPSPICASAAISSTVLVATPAFDWTLSAMAA